MNATVDRDSPAYRGQAAYNRLFLSVYDAYVYGFSSPVAWRCPKRHLLDLYERHVSAVHLDIGVATGLLLDQCRFPVGDPRLTLMDLNGVSLAHAARRLRRYAPRVHRANVLEPWGLPPGSVDSIGMFNLLHCLPGAIPEKSVVFEHARAVLRPGGTVFGVTLLGQGPAHNWLARRQLAAANWRGIMSNRRDRREDLEAALAGTFARWEVTVVGSMALFAAHAGS